MREYKTRTKIFSLASYLLECFSSVEWISLLDITSHLFVAIASLGTTFIVKTSGRKGNNSVLFSLDRGNVAYFLGRTQL